MRMRDIIRFLLLAAFALGLTPANAQNASYPDKSYGNLPTAIGAHSGNVANASAAATLAAGGATGWTYICGVVVTSSGSTAASVVSGTITGMVGGTMTFTYTSAAGVTTTNQPLVIPFAPCQAASAINTAIVVTLPALGAGNTNATVSAFGYQQFQ